jgi:hypothetical protein
MYEIIQSNSKNKHGSKLEGTADNDPPVSTVTEGVVIANHREKCDVAHFRPLRVMYTHTHTHTYVGKYIYMYSDRPQMYNY